MNKISDQELIQEIQKRLIEHHNAIEEQKKLMIKLQKVNKKLEESEALKSHFISNIRNEMINPFASILGISNQIISLCNQKEQNCREKIISMASLIHSEAFNLDFQLKNIFAAADLEAGEEIPEVANVDISELISDLTIYLNHKLKEKSLHLEVYNQLPENFYFRTDASKLQHILLNLLNNAISFSHNHQKIMFTISCQTELIFKIQDFGIGISKKNKEHIFNRFNQLNSKEIGNSHGHGLGLCVTKAFLDLINGTIDFKSEKDKGSTFTVKVREFDHTDDQENLAFGGNEIFFDAEEKF